MNFNNSTIEDMIIEFGANARAAGTAFEPQWIHVGDDCQPMLAIGFEFTRDADGLHAAAIKVLRDGRASKTLVPCDGEWISC